MAPRVRSRGSSCQSNSRSPTRDSQTASPTMSHGNADSDSPGGWWLYSQARRLFRSYRERSKTDDIPRGSTESDAPQSEAAPPRSIFRTVSAFFMRNQESDEDTPSRSVTRSTPASPEVGASTPVRKMRNRWRLNGNQAMADSDPERAPSGSDGSSETSFSHGVRHETLSDHEFIIQRSTSSASLSPTPVSALDSVDHEGNCVRPGSGGGVAADARGLRSHRDEDWGADRLSPTNCRMRSINDGLRGLSLVDSDDSCEESAAPRGSRSAMGTRSSKSGKNLSPNARGGSRREAFDDEMPGRLSSRSSRHRERRFFNFRSSISSLRRHSSASSMLSNADGDDIRACKARFVSPRRPSRPERDEDSHGSVSDSDQSPSKGRSHNADLGTCSACHRRLDSTGSHDDSCPRKGISTSITSRKERVVVLTSKPPPETGLVPLSLSKWDEQSVRKLEEIFSSLPLLKDTPLVERSDLFQRKLIACQTVIDFNAKKLLQRAIEMKRQTLLEIIEYISTTRNCMNEAVLRDVIDMVAVNVFRSLPPRSRKSPFLNDINEDEPTLEKSWPHLQIVYDVFLRVVVSNEVSSKMAKNMIDKPFVLKLLGVLNSEDQRERDYLKTILHRIYGKIMPLRNFIRKSIDNVFTSFIYETENPYGITELLEILGSIINGFAVPLKEEHKVYLKKALVPLHKPRSVRSYHAALSYCMVQYINKDRSLATPILQAILKFWPTTSAQTELLFLSELEEVLSLTEVTELREVVRAVSIRMAQCISSAHFQVAERALYIWNNDRVARLLNMHRQVVYPYVARAIKSNLEGHWNEAVLNLSFNTARRLSDTDPALYMWCEMTKPAPRSPRSFPLALMGGVPAPSSEAGEQPASEGPSTSPRDADE
ncbi:protein phosphatase 2a regulatory b subunit (b56 family) protein [Babesia caballi]|uniref:Protein phosphatase 2a regulatory b subunit (B56 family) protein n=1 Tax=Babesia caballi TaxID=5871 RepID=A0AAV4M4W0_BABCB|nr:protein phosphatase 2a regulatory b subunit (b56 family) protein [Babesia caballi]